MRILHCTVAVLLIASPGFAQQLASADLTLPQSDPATAQKQEKVLLPEGCQKLSPGIIADGFVEPEDHKPREILLEIVKLSNEKPTVGEELEAEIRLLNKGKQSIEIPWSTDSVIVTHGQGPSHFEWLGGSFRVLLRGQQDNDVLLKNLTPELYGSKFSPGSLLTLRSGEWVTAVIKFMLRAQYEIHPGPWKEGQMSLLVEWRQTAVNRNITDCKVAHGYFEYKYDQTSLLSLIQIKAEGSTKPGTGTSPELDKPTTGKSANR